MKPIKTIALALALSAAASLAHAQGACPGMMGNGRGPGMGPGMMGNGYGPGMMGTMGQLSSLNLSDEQLTQVTQIQDQVRKQHMDLMGRMREEGTRLQNMMATESPDPAAVGKQQMRVADIHRQMLESDIAGRNRIYALLTPEQRQQLRNYGASRMPAGQ